MANDDIKPTLIKVPTSADEIAVLLQPAELRRIDFSALEFPTLRRASVEYIKTYFPEDFNDFVKQNGTIMFVELTSGIGAILALRGDTLVRASFLPTAEDEEAVSNHLELINQRFKRQTPAVADIEVSLPVAAPTDVVIGHGLRFSLTGPDGRSLSYEIFRSPTDFTSNIIIPAGKRGIIAFGIEGRFGEPVTVISAGGPDQFIEIIASDVLDAPIIVEVRTGSISRIWRRVDVIEKFRPNDEVYEVRFLEDRARVVFGNDKAGKAPLAGQEIVVRYRQGGGVRGRISANVINEVRPVRPQPPSSAAVEVTFRNLQPSSGGEDKETLEVAKRRAPRDAAVHNNAASSTDYAQLAATFSHPVFGAVLKAVATVRTSINANLVEIFVLAAGPNSIPVRPSAGLKQGLKTFLTDINVMTDSTIVSDGSIKAIPVTMNVIVSRSADAATVKEQVSAAITDFFDVSRRDMGEGFNISPFISTLQQIAGVQSIVLFEPSDDILPTRNQTEDASNRVGFAQLITLGTKNIKFFFEKSSTR